MKELCLLLPFPPSTNHLFANAKKGRRKTKGYKNWIHEADFMLMKQPKIYFTGRVDIEIILGGGLKNQDASNLIKAIEDLLVRYQIIKDDNKEFVRSVKAIWDDDEVKNGAIVIVQEI